MENNRPQEHIADAILRRIREGELTQRPRLYFALHVAAAVVVSLIVLVLSVFIFNFILFSIRINSHDSLLGFGPRGFETFIYIFPWVLFFVDIALIFALEALVRRFRFAYKIPVLYLLAAIFFATLAMAFVIDSGTNVDDRMLSRADRNELPLVGPVFEQARRPMPGSGVCLCTITAISGNTITVADTRSGTTTMLLVILPANDPRATTTSLQVGDTIFIAGDESQGMIHAFGVRKVPPPEAFPQ
jgi:hypothetical protein